MSAHLEELFELLRIPSISSDSNHAADVRAACEWVCALISRAGGETRIVQGELHPFTIGHVPASYGQLAPTVMVYGHVDVQPPGPDTAWHSPPFEPEVRDGWLYARGASDDKGNLYMLLKAVEQLATSGALRANVYILCDAEEEIGGSSVSTHLAREQPEAAACLIFDGPMLRRGQPVFKTSTRGLVFFHASVSTSASDVHSGSYGGVALNAATVLAHLLAHVSPVNGDPPPELLAGIAPPSAEELRLWETLEPGRNLLRAHGIRPISAKAAGDFYARTWALPAIDVHGLTGGEPNLLKTTIPAHAEANLSIRIAPGQSSQRIASAVRKLLSSALPHGAKLRLKLLAATDPGQVDPSAPVVHAACRAFTAATGMQPLLVREGGTLPIMAALAQQNIPAIMTGFSLPEDNIHAPNERLLVESIETGVAAAQELISAIADSASEA